MENKKPTSNIFQKIIKYERIRRKAVKLLVINH